VDISTKGDADFFLFVELGLLDMRPTFYLLTNEQARSVHKDYVGSGNCVPASVRKLAGANDFSALVPALPQPLERQAPEVTL
jgi:hypothetical protein